VHIALVSTPFVSVPPRGYGGTELIVHELEQGLKRAGQKVTLLATGDSRGEDVRALYQTPIWPPEPRAEARHARFAAEQIAAGSFDVVHSHLATLLAFAEQIPVPFVHTIHHAPDERLSVLFGRHAAVRFVAISHRQAELERGLGCDVVHHGLDPARYSQSSGSGGYVLFIGRLSWCKAPDLAVAAARRAGIPIAVAGQPHEDQDPPGWREELMRGLRAPGVHWVGSVGAKAKRTLLEEARALLVPLRWEEPFGLVMIEAMLSGCPVVAFPWGAAPELVEPGLTGLLVRDEREMAEALLQLQRFDRAACRRRACERFSAERMVRDYLEIYRRAIAGFAGSTRAGGEEWALRR
jgi:glycosyltransferase involved in cell wall biosynthesis